MSRTGVLFVCTGNICRSPTAEGVFLDQIAKAGLQERVFADSAGTQGYHAGDPPDPRSVRIAAGYGINIGDLRARQVQRVDFDTYDLIVALDRGHLAALERMDRGKRAKLALLLSFAPGLGLEDVPDPYYEGNETFHAAFRLIEKGVEGLVQHLGDLTSHDRHRHARPSAD